MIRSPKKRKKVKQIEKKKQSSPTSNETLASSSPEFSPIVYWREPIPDVEILGLEASCNSEIVSVTKSSDDELKRCLSLDNKSVWFEKSKCDDAEAKLHVKKSQEAKKSSTKEKHEDKSKSKPKKSAGQQGKASEKTTNKDYEINDYGDKTLEDVLEDFRCDNDRFRTQIIGLSQIIDNLQIRIGHLESKPAVEASRKLSSESDEGVDMSEIAYKKGQSMMKPALTSTSTAHPTVGVSLRNSHQ